MSGPDKDMKAYLARIRKTIADSERVVSQAALRVAETDRMLEQHGLTREQVMAMRFSEAQIEAVNEELKRRGLDPLEKWTMADGGGGSGMEEPAADGSVMDEGGGASNAELENRQKKFGMMMKPFQI